MRRHLLLGTAAMLLAVLPAHVQTTPLEPSQPVTALLSPEHPEAIYTFEAEAGTVISATLRSATFDSLLTLTFPAELGQLTDDDSADLRDAHIGPVQLPVSGTYQLTAQSTSPLQTESAFTLTLRHLEVETLRAPRRRNNTLTDDAAMLVYRLPVEQGAVYSLNAAATDFDPVLTLSHAETPTEPPLRDDDSARRTYALIAPYVSPVSEELLIGVSAYALTGSGRFTLTPRRYSPLRLADDQPVTLSLFDRMPFLLAAFEGTSGERISLLVEGDAERDTVLQLIDPAGQIIAVADDDDDLHPSLQSFSLPETGRYQVLVSPIMAGLSVNVTLTLRRA